MAEELLPLMTKMATDIGEIRGILIAHTATLTQHIAEDVKLQTSLANNIKSLEIEQAKAIGANKFRARLLTGALTVLSGSAGFFTSWFVKH